jgi:hypothetical protein
MKKVKSKIAQFFREMGDLAFLPPDRKSSKLISRVNSGQHEHQTITQARSDKKIVRTAGRNAVTEWVYTWMS